MPWLEEEDRIIVSINHLPHQWETQRCKVTDSALDEVQELQQIYDANPQIRGWAVAKGEDEPEHPMLAAFTEGALPPGGSKALFRLQSIRLNDTAQLIGFLGTYHGFPKGDMFWITVLAIQPNFQDKGYGKELMQGLSKVVKQLDSYTRMRTFVNLKNWPSLRLCVHAGFDKIVQIVGDSAHTDEADSYVMVEKSLG
jgi:ribosomal protein S18 acetylase RimI-like enzyme